MHPSPFILIAGYFTAAACQAQIFQFEQVYLSFPSNGGGGVLSGDVTVDPTANTAAIDGTLSSPADSWSQALAQTIIVPGPFPHIDIYTSNLAITYSTPASDQLFSLPPVEPVSVGGSNYRLSFSPEIFEAVINFEYELKENGVSITTGSGSYLVRGGPPSVTLDVIDYPNSLGITYPTHFQLSPTDSSPIISVTTPHGGSFNVLPQSLSYNNAVPEPEFWATACSGALLAFAVLRRKAKASAS